MVEGTLVSLLSGKLDFRLALQAARFLALPSGEAEPGGRLIGTPFGLRATGRRPNVALGLAVAGAVTLNAGADL
jgi:hypothetical protein